LILNSHGTSVFKFVNLENHSQNNVKHNEYLEIQEYFSHKYKRDFIDKTSLLLYKTKDTKLAKEYYYKMMGEFQTKYKLPIIHKK
jgi:hypothetical protein